MFFEIPLDQVFCAVFTDARSEERTPIGAVRRGLRPSPHRSRGGSGVGARTVFTATSDRAVGLLREGGGNDESATATGDRSGSRVRPGRRSPSGGGRKRRPAGAFGRCGATRGRRAVRRGDRVRRASSDGRWATELWLRSRRNWGHPNWTQRGRFRLAPGPGHGQPGQREAVPTGSGPGNWCRVRNAASPATPKGETGDVNRSSRRLTPDVRPVVDLSTSSPEGCAGESRSPDGALSFFPNPNPRPQPPDPQPQPPPNSPRGAR